MEPNKYLFTSERLGFRAWNDDDLEEFAKLNADPDVMEHFPNILRFEESEDFLKRLHLHFQKYGYQYFAVEILENAELIGFIGMAHQTYDSEFTPNTDLGWRLKKSAWGKGYATEGAKRCIEYAFNELGLEKLIATCTENNIKSEKVMQKIGMKKKGNFLHPKLVEYPSLQKCVCYEISRKM